MKIRGVFALVVVAAGAVASAEPKPEENTGRLSYKDDEPVDHTAHADPDWVQLASPTPASHGTEFVVVGKEAGLFRRLRLEAATGTVIMRRVHVFFDDGKQKIVDVDKVMRAQRGSTEWIELGEARAIDRIVVTTEPQTKGSYAIYGSGAAP
ncbi:MAG TPA: hypothetical protein VMJ10_37815 [Kofleriaceae bacterium]|nr:hypothetical protein [Kofleriaceae bacterium]